MNKTEYDNRYSDNAADDMALRVWLYLWRVRQQKEEDSND